MFATVVRSEEIKFFEGDRRRGNSSEHRSMRRLWANRNILQSSHLRFSYANVTGNKCHSWCNKWKDGAIDLGYSREEDMIKYIKIAVSRCSKERDAEKEREREEDFCLIIEIRSCRNENEGKTRLVCLFR